MPFLSQYPSLPGGIQSGDVLLVGRGGAAFSIPATELQGATGLLALLEALIPTLPTAPSATGTTLWLNGPGDGTGVLTWS